MPWLRDAQKHLNFYVQASVSMTSSIRRVFRLTCVPLNHYNLIRHHPCADLKLKEFIQFNVSEKGCPLLTLAINERSRLKKSATVNLIAKEVI